MNEEISPYFKEIVNDGFNAHRQNNQSGPDEVTQYISGGKSTQRKYIVMKNGSKRRMLVRLDEENHKYVMSKGTKILLSSIRGKYAYV
jgi:hypothetical protein